MIKKVLAVLFLYLFISSFIATISPADVKLKVAVVNPSDKEGQDAPVRYDLPKGIAPEDITDIGSMELKYDFDKGNYYLYSIVHLKPSEKQVLEIKMRDIWTTPQKDINFLKNHTKTLKERLANTRHAKIGERLAGKITERLDDIVKKESDQNLSMGERINLYYEDVGIMGEVKEDVGMLENLVLDVGGIVENRVQVPATLAMPIKPNAANPEKVVDLNIRVSNPSTTKQSTSVKYLLPEEAAPRYVVDRGDLEMGYDFLKKSFYVYKDDVALQPSETKIFVVKIMDVWQVPDVEIEALRSHTDNLMLLLKGTEFDKTAKPMAGKIKQDLQEVTANQSLKVQAEEHISYYRKDQGLLQDARGYISQLEKLANQSGASVGVTIKEAEIRKGGGPKASRPRGYEGIDYIARSIFRGKAPTPATTWKIIFAIIAFLALLGGSFYWLWYSQIKESQGREKKLKEKDKSV